MMAFVFDIISILFFGGKQLVQTSKCGLWPNWISEIGEIFSNKTLTLLQSGMDNVYGHLYYNDQ